MNENIDLTKILKNCPIGWEFYSSVLGEVELVGIYDEDKQNCQVIVQPVNKDYTDVYTKEGVYYKGKGECTLFPSKDQRDWSKFAAPWYKKEKFDKKTLKPFDKVLACDLEEIDGWVCGWFSYYNESGGLYPCRCVGSSYRVCIPYNDETKHLVGTAGEVPEYYKYWEE